MQLPAVCPDKPACSWIYTALSSSRKPKTSRQRALRLGQRSVLIAEASILLVQQATLRQGARRSCCGAEPPAVPCLAFQLAASNLPGRRGVVDVTRSGACIVCPLPLRQFWFARTAPCASRSRSESVDIR
jgi:hypothetical protein